MKILKTKFIKNNLKSYKNFQDIYDINNNSFMFLKNKAKFNYLCQFKFSLFFRKYKLLDNKKPIKNLFNLKDNYNKNSVIESKIYNETSFKSK